MNDSRQTLFDPIGFKEISYNNQKQISYLSDVAAAGPKYVSFLEALNYSQVGSNERSHYDSIADDLYKKIVKQGYLQRPSKVSRKSKKGDSDVNYYNSADAFIDDEECCIEKKDKTSVFEDYQSIPVTSLEQLYANPIYTKRVEDVIVQLGKRKAPEQFSLDEEQDLQKFDAMRKNIKLSLLNRSKNQAVAQSEKKVEDQRIPSEEVQQEKAPQKQPEIVDRPAIIEISQQQEEIVPDEEAIQRQRQN